MKKMGLFLAVLIVLLSGNSFGDDVWGDDVWKETEISILVSRPHKFKIVPPEPNLPLAFLSGRWEGVWSDIDMPTLILVEKVSASSVNFFYCFGRGKYNQANYYSVKAEITGERTFEFTSVGTKGANKFRFELKEDGTLHGKCISSRMNIEEVVFKKVQ